MLLLPLILVVFAMFAVRSLCGSPISMESAWIFRLHDWGGIRNVRKALRGVLSAAVIFPAAMACLAFHVWAWNSWLACTHTVFLIVVSMVVMEWILRKIHHVPFTQLKPEHLGRQHVAEVHVRTEAADQPGLLVLPRRLEDGGLGTDRGDHGVDPSPGGPVTGDRSRHGVVRALGEGGRVVYLRDGDVEAAGL